MVNIRGSGFRWKIQEFCGKIWENWKKKILNAFLNLLRLQSKIKNLSNEKKILQYISGVLQQKC